MGVPAIWPGTGVVTQETKYDRDKTKSRRGNGIGFRDR